MKQSTQTPQTALTIDAVSQQLGQDVKNAVLIVSLVANLAVFTTWLTILLV